MNFKNIPTHVALFPAVIVLTTIMIVSAQFYSPSDFPMTYIVGTGLNWLMAGICYHFERSRRNKLVAVHNG